MLTEVCALYKLYAEILISRSGVSLCLYLHPLHPSNLWSQLYKGWCGLISNSLIWAVSVHVYEGTAQRPTLPRATPAGNPNGGARGGERTDRRLESTATFHHPNKRQMLPGITEALMSFCLKVSF